MTTMSRRKLNGKSKASKIRKLINKGELTPAEIATKLGVAINYVYVIKGQMKQDGLIRALPPVDPLLKPVPTSSVKRPVGRPPKNPVRIEPKLESLSEPLPLKGVTYVYEAPRNEFGIIASPPIGLWNMFIAKLRRWLAK